PEKFAQIVHALEATPQASAAILCDMADWFEQVVQLMLSALGLLNMPDIAALDLTALSLALALLAVTSIVAAIVLGIVHTAQGSSPHPLRAIDASILLSQSDPGADGH